MSTAPMRLRSSRSKRRDRWHLVLAGPVKAGGVDIGTILIAGIFVVLAIGVWLLYPWS